MHEAIVLYTKDDDGVVLGRLGGLEPCSPWDGAGEMAESRAQGWPVGGWALLGDRLCRIQFSLLLAGRLFNGRRIRRRQSCQACQDGMPHWEPLTGRGGAHSPTRQQRDGERDLGSFMVSVSCQPNSRVVPGLSPTREAVAVWIRRHESLLGTEEGRREVK